MNNYELSKEFWAKIIVIVDLLVLIITGILAYCTAKPLMQLIGGTLSSILGLIVILGPISYINYALNKELNRRFPH